MRGHSLGVGEEQDLAAAADDPERLVDGCVGRNSNHRCVHNLIPNTQSRIKPPTTGTLGLRLWTLHQPRPSGAKFSGQFQPRFQQVPRKHPDAGQLQEPREHQTNRSLAGHEDGVAVQQVQAANGFEDGINGFEHCALLKGILGWNFHDARQDKGHHADVLGVAAACRLEPGGDAGAFVGLALGKGAVPAEMAIQARDMMMEGHAVADLKIANRRFLIANFHNRAGGFVAEDARGSNSTVLDFFDVGGADAADADFHEQFVTANARDRNGFQAEVVDAAIDDGAHGFGDGKHRSYLATDETQLKHGFFEGRMVNQETAGNSPDPPRLISGIWDGKHESAGNIQHLTSNQTASAVNCRLSLLAGGGAAKV